MAHQLTAYRIASDLPVELWREHVNKLPEPEREPVTVILRAKLAIRKTNQALQAEIDARRVAVVNIRVGNL